MKWSPFSSYPITFVSQIIWYIVKHTLDISLVHRLPDLFQRTLVYVENDRGAWGRGHVDTFIYTNAQT